MCPTLTSLAFDADPVDQPSATDPLERATWSALQITVSHRIVTRLLDHALQAERKVVYVPGFPIAEWLVHHWWSLLWEPCRWERLPSRLSEEPEFSWTKRHCLRASDSELLLPALYLFDNGPHLRAEWQPDQDGGWTNLPGEFIDSSPAGGVALDRESVAEELRRFCREILGRVEGRTEERVTSLRQDLDAIVSATPEEQAWCRFVGRMGLDPYRPDDIPTGAFDFLQTTPEHENRPALWDLAAVSNPNSMASQWKWVTETAKANGMGPSRSQPLVFEPAANQTPAAEHGYALARLTRERAQLDPDTPIGSVEEVLRRAFGVDFRIGTTPTHSPTKDIRLVCGWDQAGVVLAGPPLKSAAPTRRFASCRGAYLALSSAKSGERLATEAHDWDQRASRAYAAELLAPQSALAHEARAGASPDLVEKLASRFQASQWLITHQLENARLPVSIED